MDTVSVAVAQLRTMAAPYSPNRMSEAQLEALRRSLREFGVVQPVVVNRTTGHIVGGHQRVLAAEAEGLDTLPVVYVDMDETREMQCNLALNKIVGDDDPEQLAAVLTMIEEAEADLALTGFTEEELDELLSTVDDDDTEVPPAPEPPDVAATQSGDVIVLGDHRLICGDVGDPEVLDTLLAGESADLLFTDPPYNVSVKPRGYAAITAGSDGPRAAGFHPTSEKLRARDRAIENDQLSEEEFARRLREWFGRLARALRPGGSFYVWGGFANWGNYPPALAEAELYFAHGIIWRKNHAVPGRKDFMTSYECCFYGWRTGAGHSFHGPKNVPDVWDVDKVPHQRSVHLTEKPVELALRALEYSTRRGAIVLDGFGGSGSTLIACEQVSRRARVVELDPLYCDVIVQRWQEFTGRKAEGWRGNEMNPKGESGRSASAPGRCRLPRS